MKANQLLSFIIGVAGMSALLPGCLSGESSRSGYYTRGVGAYPGDPAEDFAPELVVDNGYRNIAGMRSAYHSSSYDYNLTAQLTTDGIIASSLPATINVSTQNGDLLKNEREWLFDGKSDSKYRMEGGDVFLRLALNNIDLHVDRIALRGSVTYDAAKPLGYEITAYGSDDGESWTVIGEDKGAGRIGTPPPVFRGFGGFMRPPVDPDAPKPSFTFNFPAPEPSTNIDQVFELDGAVNYSFYKISISMPSAKEWSFGDWDFYNGDELLAVTPSGYFSSAWESAGTGEEWVYVDFGAPASFDKVNLHWINKALTGAIQVSGDAKTWSNIATLPGGDDRTDVIELTKKARGQYLRVLMTEAENNLPYVLSELEVWGEGGLSPRAHKQPEPGGDRLALSGGGWKLSRASEVGAGGEDISLPGFNHDGWIIATVPGTVLTSYLRIGALPDPNYADNQLQVSESFFNSDFWYRDEFDLPASFDGGRVFLNFDGINWKANVFVNGQKAGRVEGAFMRGKFDVTGLVAKGKNAIAVEIIKNAHPGAIKEQTALSTDQNGGILGADNPTFHASVGWDWIPTIRGRNIGIWNDVFLTHSGAVTIEDPFIRAELPLPDTTSAALFVEVTLKNHTDSPVTGTLKGAYGDITFEQEVTLGASETRLISLTPLTTPALNIKDPILWWPKGYGEPYLYDASLSFETGSGLSDHTAFKSGIRQMTFNEDNNTLTMFVNGRRFIGFGGNWGFGESNLNYRGREYDIAVAYHADMNFTMIRNWVGQIGDEEFYEACDRHGVMVWQDFWLANPVDGPNPYDNDLFIANAEDFVKRIRNHPSIGIYVGRNEGNPPEALDNAIRSIVPDKHPGIHYISNSAMGVVSGGGPYRALPPRDYFLLYGNDKFHSERGMPNVMNYESLVQTFSPEALWPQNSQYGLHDYTLGSAQSAASFNAMIEKAFGRAPADARQFAEWAQWINYNGYRAIFEGRSQYRRGMQLWMSHPAWPSMVWQTYDYYFDPTAAYFGCKKGAEPIHIQWNPVYDYKKKDFIEVVNYHALDRTALTAKAQLINQDGAVQWEKETILDVPDDSTVKAFELEFPGTLSDTYFIKLTLTENGRIISDNFYVRGKEDGDYKSLLTLPKTDIEAVTTATLTGDEWIMRTTLSNKSSVPALMVRVKVTGKKTAARILPVFFSDNYIALMPGEEKTVTMRLSNRDTRGETPQAEVSAFNL